MPPRLPWPERERADDDLVEVDAGADLRARAAATPYAQLIARPTHERADRAAQHALAAVDHVLRRRTPGSAKWSANLVMPLAYCDELLARSRARSSRPGRRPRARPSRAAAPSATRCMRQSRRTQRSAMKSATKPAARMSSSVDVARARRPVQLVPGRDDERRQQQAVEPRPQRGSPAGLRAAAQGARDRAPSRGRSPARSPAADRAGRTCLDGAAGRSRAARGAATCPPAATRAGARPPPPSGGRRARGPMRTGRCGRPSMST